MKMFKMKLGLWIDLTNTKRFYDRRDIECRGTKYVKLQCRGHGETPSPEQTRAFIEIVDNFISEHPLDIVGVHCTHGFNRTGFLIVSYMVEKMDCSVEAALMAFAQSRPPGIYKEDYIKELFRRYEDEDDAPPAPALPNWCFEDEEQDEVEETDFRQNKPGQSGTSTTTGNSDNEDDVLSADPDPSGSTSAEGDSAGRKKRPKEKIRQNATFMVGVPGVTLVTDQPRLSQLQHLVQDMCEWKSTGFPGSQPVSMDQQNIKLLHQKPYRVSWKADGTRYMMLINKENEIYFFDRDNSCFQVSSLKFPHRRDLKRHLKDTLLDGEMVIDKVNGLSIPRYLVYDIVKFEGEDICKMPFYPNRLHCLKMEIINPRYEAMKHGLIDKQREPFSVRDKSFWDLVQARALLGPKFAKTLSHEPDGLIFQPSSEPYKPGRCDEVLKWKPLNMNSVDFKLKISTESGMGMLNSKIALLYVGNLEVPFSQMKYTKSLKELDNKIIECNYENGQWVFMRERVDKSYPNGYATAVAVCNSIKNPVTTEILLDFIDSQRYMNDTEIMPPPAKRRR